MAPRIALALLALAPGAAAFGGVPAGHSRLFGAPMGGRAVLRTPAAPVEGLRVAPLNAFGRKEKPAPEPAAEDLQRELARHYRTLGVRAEADFGEIADQTERLREKYKGDIKKVKTIEIAKDRIMELKLAQRMQGSLAVSSGAVEYDASREAYEDRKKRSKKVPTWIKYIGKMYAPPTTQERTRFAIYFGGSAMASFLVPHMHGALGGITFMLATSMLYTKRAGLQFSNPGEAYSAQMPTIRFRIVGITIAMVAAGYVLGTLVMRTLTTIIGPFLVPGTPQFGGVASNLGYFFVCSYFRTNPEGMQKKRKKRR